MNRFTIILLSLLFFTKTNAQSMAGVTGIPDTSFTTNSAYLNTKKTHPDIKLPSVSWSPDILEKYNLVYCHIGNRDRYLEAFYPKKKKKRLGPAIIILHGGGWRSGDGSQHYPLARKLAQLGYVCFLPEYRLSTEALYPAAIYDVKSAIRWVKSKAGKYNIDTSAITVLGFSAGGELAAMMGTTNDNPGFEGDNCNLKYSSRINAVIDIDGILSFTHPESGEGDDTKRISAATNWLGYPKKDNPSLWEQASPLTYAGKTTPPTLFINSSVDRMHAGRNDYIKILNGYNTYTELHAFEGAPHPFCLFDPWFEPTVKYIDAFLKKIYPR